MVQEMQVNLQVLMEARGVDSRLSRWFFEVVRQEVLVEVRSR